MFVFLGHFLDGRLWSSSNGHRRRIPPALALRTNQRRLEGTDETNWQTSSAVRVQESLFRSGALLAPLFQGSCAETRALDWPRNSCHQVRWSPPENCRGPSYNRSTQGCVPRESSRRCFLGCGWAGPLLAVRSRPAHSKSRRDGGRPCRRKSDRDGVEDVSGFPSCTPKREHPPVVVGTQRAVSSSVRSRPVIILKITWRHFT